MIAKTIGMDDLSLAGFKQGALWVCRHMSTTISNLSIEIFPVHFFLAPLNSPIAVCTACTVAIHYYFPGLISMPAIRTGIYRLHNTAPARGRLEEQRFRGGVA